MYLPRAVITKVRVMAPRTSLNTSRFAKTVYLVLAAVLTLTSAQLFYGYLLLQTGGDWSAPLDDVFIHFDYARATARGFPFQWSEGNGYSSGNTSITYPFVLALGYWIGFRGPSLMVWALMIAAISVLAFLWVIPRWFRGLPHWTSWFAPPFMLSVGGLCWTLWSGMEVALLLMIWAAMSALCFDLLEKRISPTKGGWLIGLVGAAMVMTRPESATTLACSGLFVVIGLRKRNSWIQHLQTLARIGLPGAAALVIQMVSNRMLTGEASANGAIAKLAYFHPYMSSSEKIDNYLGHLKWSVERICEHHLGNIFPWGYLPLALAILALADRRTRFAAAWLLSCVVSWYLLVALNGQVRWQNQRYLMPAVAWGLIASTLGLGVLLVPDVPFQSPKRTWRLWMTNLAALGAIGLGLLVVAEWTHLLPTSKSYGIHLAEMLVGSISLAALLVGQPQSSSRWQTFRLLTGTGAALVIVGLYWYGEHTQYRDQVWFFGRASRNIHDQQMLVGTKLRLQNPRPRRVLVGDAGAIMYTSDLPGFDIIGLGGYGKLPLARAGVHGLGATLELMEHMAPADRPDVFAIYPHWFRELPHWFGQRLYAVPAPGNVICAGYEKVVYQADWHLLGTGNTPRSLQRGENLVATLDVADLISERQAEYVFPHPHAGYVSMRVLPDPHQPQSDMWDAGRLIPDGRSETMKFRALPTGKPLRLLIRTVADEDLKIQVETGSFRQSVAVKKQPGWVEVSVPIPAEHVHSEMSFRLTPLAGEWITYHLWLAHLPS
jgi:hypothetical protein